MGSPEYHWPSKGVLDEKQLGAPNPTSAKESCSHQLSTESQSYWKLPLIPQPESQCCGTSPQGLG